jgi:hypothetical protein
MRRIIGFLCVIIGFGGSALAADLPPSPPPRAPAAYVPAVLPVYNYVYVGINGGWGWGNVKYTANAINTFPGATGSVHDNGGVVGGTLGVNWRACWLRSRPRPVVVVPVLMPGIVPVALDAKDKRRWRASYCRSGNCR